MIIRLPEIIYDLAMEATKDHRVFDVLHDKLLDLGVDSNHWTVWGIRDKLQIEFVGNEMASCFMNWRFYNTITQTFSDKNVWKEEV